MSFALLRMAGIDPEAPEFLLQDRKEQGIAAKERMLHRLWGADGLVKRWHEAAPDRIGYTVSRLVSPWDKEKKDEDPGRLWQTTLREVHTNWLKSQYELESRETDPRDELTRNFYRDAAP